MIILVIFFLLLGLIDANIQKNYMFSDNLYVRLVIDLY